MGGFSEPAHQPRLTCQSSHFHSHFPSYPLPVSDRLNDLQRQRALAQEQLAWLDREIARETGTPAPPAAVPAAPATALPPARPVEQPTAPSAEEIIAQFQGQARPVHDEVKRGCLLYFFAAFAALILALITFWFLTHR